LIFTHRPNRYRPFSNQRRAEPFTWDWSIGWSTASRR